MSTTEAELAAMRQSSASVGLVVVIVVVLLAVALITLDLACFFVKKRGITMVIRQRFFPASVTRANKEKAIEDGEKEHLTANNDENKKTDQANDDVKEKIKLEEIDEKNDTSKTVEEEEKEALKKDDVVAADDGNTTQKE